MTRGQALHDLERTLVRLNLLQERCGLPPLERSDMTWLERQMELDSRVNAICRGTVANGRPNMALLDALGAQVLAAKIALAEAESVDVSAGDEETTPA